MAQAKSSEQFSEKTTKRLYWVLWLGALSPVLLITFLLMKQSSDDIPDVESLKNPQELLASVVFADDGETELGRYWRVNRTSAEYKDIAPAVFDALISTEDERFMEHSGVDFRALTRAIVNMGRKGGASTISQQLAKLLYTLEKRKKEQEARSNGLELANINLGRINEKAIENIVATKLEKHYTKEEIITMYLNQFDFLYNAVGIQNAARVYFNKEPKDLTKSEAATLVGMVKNPSLYNPYSYQVENYRKKIALRNNVQESAVSAAEVQEARAKDSLRIHERRNQVLMQWLKNSDKNNSALITKITREEYDALKTQPIVTNYQRVDHKKGLAPYLREELRKEVVELLEAKDENTGKLKIAKSDGSAYDIYGDGLKIYTTINVAMQEYGEWAVQEHLKADLQKAFDKNNKGLKNYPYANSTAQSVVESEMRRARLNSDRFRNMTDEGISDKEITKSFYTPVPMKVFSWNGDIDTVLSPNDSIKYYKSFLQAGLCSIEPQTGFVKAWVGGINFDYFAYDHVRQAKRQVGSTIKPFVYGTALLMGVCKPCTPFSGGYCVDVTDENGNVMNRWCPGGEAAGTMAQGLAASSNPTTVAVMSTMGGNAGPKNIAKLLQDLDLVMPQNQIVPAMCLGTPDFSLYNMTAAQAMWVNQGIYNRPTVILRIEDRNGNVIYSADGYSKEVMNANVAYEIIKMMKGVIQFGTSTRLRANRPYGNISYPTAGKTGTTQSNSDGWFMGLTPDLVTGVWVGAEDRNVRFRSTALGQGANMALPIYGYYMNKVYKDSKIKISTGDFEVPIGYDPAQFNCGNEQGGPDLPDLF